jgi:hypothetical protein
MKDRKIKLFLSRGGASGKKEGKWRRLRRANMVDVLCMHV